MHTPQLSPINKSLIIAAVALFLIESIVRLSLGTSLTPYLALSLSGLLGGWVTQLLSFPFAETQLIAVIFNGLILWFLGSECEWTFGPRRYLLFVLGTLLVCAVGFLAISLVVETRAYLLGLSALTSSLCIAYAIMYPDRNFSFMMLFPMKAWMFCGLMIAIILYQGAFQSSLAQSLGQLMSMAFAWFFVRSIRGESALPFLKNLQGRSSKRPGSGKSHLKLVKKDEEEPPKYWH